LRISRIFNGLETIARLVPKLFATQYDPPKPKNWPRIGQDNLHGIRAFYV
jgi:hypothetical protein